MVAASASAVSSSSSSLSIGGRVFFGSLCAGTFGLGVWQTQRLFEKRELIEQRNAGLALQPRREHYLQKIPSTTQRRAQQQQVQQQQQWQRVLLTGKYLHEREFLVGPRGPPAGALPHQPGSSQQGMASAPQGYYVITPLLLLLNNNQQQDSSTTSGEQQQPAMVLVNRGWVPRRLVVGQKQQQQQQRGAAPVRFQQQQRPQQQQQEEDKEDLLRWNRPEGTVQVLAVPAAKPEEPRFIVPHHDLNSKPVRLFWFDWKTMRQIIAAEGGLGDHDDGHGSDKDSSNHDNNNDGDDNSNNNDDGILLVTAIQPEDQEQQRQQKQDPETISWPVSPPADKVGEFKVSPAIHAAYAVTWFSLSGAGMYMTRMLLTKGRRG